MSRRSRFIYRAIITASGLLLAPASLYLFSARAASPGGALAVGGPNFGVSGTPIIWNPAAMPLQYRVDPGPMAFNPFTGKVVVDSAAAISRVGSMFATWAGVPTAALSTQNAGSLLAYGAYTGGAVAAGGLASFNAVVQSCDAGVQSPIIFDPQGNLFRRSWLELRRDRIWRALRY
jgi:hypothetical protein